MFDVSVGQAQGSSPGDKGAESAAVFRSVQAIRFSGEVTVGGSGLSLVADRFEIVEIHFVDARVGVCQVLAQTQGECVTQVVGGAVALP